MHKSLTAKTNRVLIACWALGVISLAILTAGALPLCAVGAAAGVGAGVLQARTLRSEASTFARTVTAMDVRRVLAGSGNGKMAIAIGWLCGVILLILAFVGGAGPVAIARWLAGYLAFMLMRDVVAYPALRTVAASQIAS